jgi:hypothetical protein
LADFVAEVRVNASGKKWIIVTDLGGEPAFVLDSHHFLRDALLKHPDKIPGACLHRPVVVRDMQTSYRPRHRRAYVVFVDGFPGAPSSPHPSPRGAPGFLHYNLGQPNLPARVATLSFRWCSPCVAAIHVFLPYENS